MKSGDVFLRHYMGEEFLYHTTVFDPKGFVYREHRHTREHTILFRMNMTVQVEGLFQLLPSLQYSLHPDDVQTGSVYVQQEAKEDELLFFIKAQRIASKFDIDPDDLEKGKILYTNIIPSTTIPTKDLILYSHWIYKTPKYFKLLESAD